MFGFPLLGVGLRCSRGFGILVTSTPVPPGFSELFLMSNFPSYRLRHCLVPHRLLLYVWCSHLVVRCGHRGLSGLRWAAMFCFKGA